MSFVFEDNLYQDTENNGPRRGKNVTIARNNAPKRAALGVITNQVRVQPFRAAKVFVVFRLIKNFKFACTQTKPIR